MLGLFVWSSRKVYLWAKHRRDVDRFLVFLLPVKLDAESPRFREALERLGVLERQEGIQMQPQVSDESSASIFGRSGKKTRST
jgi:hypothetical protein